MRHFILSLYDNESKLILMQLFDQILRSFRTLWMRTWVRRNSNQSGSRKLISLLVTWQIRKSSHQETGKRMVLDVFVEENWKEFLMEIIPNLLCPDVICFITMIRILVKIDFWANLYQFNQNIAATTYNRISLGLHKSENKKWY